MAGDPTFQLQAQEQLLRDIRDELRNTRQQTAGQGAAPGRPSPGFVQAQMTADRMVAGEWASLGWANAYQTPIKSSLANDMMGAMGMRAAPQSMWQREYELMSGSMLADRVTSFPADLVMPGFGRHSRELGAQMYQMSGRFSRSGDGTHPSIHSAMNMAREIQIGAATDMRLSGKDYNQVFSQSAQAGQFDFAGNLGDVKSQFNELRNAVADLTKTMRVGAGEVAQTMGAFRQFGIVDVADQRRMAERMSVSARVAGISTPEMAGMVRSGIESGMSLGLGAQGSAALSENLAMAARDASRAGLISGHVMAAAGGVQGMVAAQQQAINQFAASGAGYYTSLGMANGGDGSSLGNMIAGLGATGGTLGGVVAAESRKLDMLGGMSGATRQRMFNRNIEQQMGMLNIDPGSPEATDYAFTMVRGQMGDAAGLAYARQNFSATGRKQRWAEMYRSEMEVENQSSQRSYQMKMENETMFGQVRQMTGQFGAGLGSAGMGIGRFFGGMGRTVGGWVGMRSSSFEQAQDAMGLTGDDALSAEGAAGAAVEAFKSQGKGQSRENAIKLTGSVTTGQTILGNSLMLGGGLAGGFAGFKAGALLGSFGGPIGAVAGGLIGGAAGYLAAGWVGGHADATGLTGSDATSYLAAARGMTGGISDRAANIAQGKESQVLEALSGNQAFQRLISVSNRGKMSDSDSKQWSADLQTAATHAGINVEDVAGVVRSMGIDATMQDSYNSAKAGAGRYTDAMKNVMDGVEGSGLSIASTEVATGVQNYAKARTVSDQNIARARLASAGISGRSMDNLMKQMDSVGTMGSAERMKLAEDAGDYVSTQGSVAVDKRFRAFGRVAENIASEVAAAGEAGGMDAYKRIKELEKDPAALMELMTGGGDTKDAPLRDFLSRRDDTGMMQHMRELGSMQDLMSESADEQLVTLSGLDKGQLKQMRDKVGSMGGTDSDRTSAMRKGIASMMVSQSQAVKQSASPEGVAASNMLLAATILREIQGKISGDASTKGDKK
jgi:hypothetical protein